MCYCLKNGCAWNRFVYILTLANGETSWLRAHCLKYFYNEWAASSGSQQANARLSRVTLFRLKDAPLLRNGASQKLPPLLLLLIRNVNGKIRQVALLFVCFVFSRNLATFLANAEKWPLPLASWGNLCQRIIRRLRLKDLLKLRRKRSSLALFVRQHFALFEGIISFTSSVFFLLLFSVSEKTSYIIYALTECNKSYHSYQIIMAREGKVLH